MMVSVGVAGGPAPESRRAGHFAGPAPVPASGSTTFRACSQVDGLPSTSRVRINRRDAANRLYQRIRTRQKVIFEAGHALPSILPQTNHARLLAILRLLRQGEFNLASLLITT